MLLQVTQRNSMSWYRKYAWIMSLVFASFAMFEFFVRSNPRGAAVQVLLAIALCCQTCAASERFSKRHRIGASIVSIAIASVGIVVAIRAS
jgi:hypothetical protein